MARKINLLQKLGLDEVSVVDDPANQHARVVLLKRDSDCGIITRDEQSLLDRMLKRIRGDDRNITEGDEVDKAEFEKLQKSIASLTETVETLKKDIQAKDEKIAKIEADAKAERERAEKASKFSAFRAGLTEKLQKEFDELESDEEKEEFMERMGKVGKSGDEGDDPVAKALAKVEKENADLRGELNALKQDAEIRKAAEELADVRDGVKDFDAFVKSVVALRKTNKDAADVLVDNTRALAKQAKEAGLFRVVGKDGVGDGTAESRLEKAAARVRAEHPDLTAEQAMAKALERDPSLYEDYNFEKDGARAA